MRKEDLTLIRDGLARHARRKVVALLIAAPLLALATFVVLAGRSLVVPGVIAGFCVLGAGLVWWRANASDHPLLEMLEHDPLIIKRVRVDERPIGLIVWRVATSHLMQIEAAGDEHYTLAFSDAKMLRRALEVFRSRATHADIETDGGSDDEEKPAVEGPRSQARDTDDG